MKIWVIFKDKSENEYLINYDKIDFISHGGNSLYLHFSKYRLRLKYNNENEKNEMLEFIKKDIERIYEV